MLESRRTSLACRDSVLIEENMREAEFRKKKAELQEACQERDELRGRIDEAERDLKEMLLLMEEFKSEGKKAEFEEIDNAYQQSYPDYADLLRQLAWHEQEIQAMHFDIKSTKEYVRDTGFFPGL